MKKKFLHDEPKTTVTHKDDFIIVGWINNYENNFPTKLKSLFNGGKVSGFNKHHKIVSTVIAEEKYFPNGDTESGSYVFGHQGRLSSQVVIHKFDKIITASRNALVNEQGTFIGERKETEVIYPLSIKKSVNILDIFYR